MTALPLALLLVLQHGDDPHMEHVYFWSAILIVVVPLLVFGGIGVWLWRMYRAEREPRRTEGGATLPR
jgi:hypothetical protein